MDDLLPAMSTSSTAVEGQVKILTAGPLRPAILDRLHKVRIDPAVVAKQAARYAALKAPTSADVAAGAAFTALGGTDVIIDLENTLRGRHRSNQSNETEPLLGIGRPRDKLIYSRIFGYNGEIIDYFNTRPRRFAYITPFFSVQKEGAARGSVWRTARSLVPAMPEEVVEAFPAAVKAKSGWLLIWEANWTHWSEHQPRPRINWDPALLEHVAGTLYRVVAAWDLTAVEAAALSLPPVF